MTTDEMILALVATGKFAPPSGLYPLENNTFQGHGTLTHAQVHDLCAMHFARELDRIAADTYGGKAGPDFRPLAMYMRRGDSAAAIKALYEAVCAKEPPCNL